MLDILIGAESINKNFLNANKLLFFGDSWTDNTWEEKPINFNRNHSLIRHWTDIVSTALSVPAVNTAIEGTSPTDYLNGTHSLNERIFSHNPSHVMFLFGCNDMIVKNLTAVQAIANVRNILNQIIVKEINVIPIFYGNIPYAVNNLANGQWNSFTTLYRNLMNELGLTLIDLSYSSINAASCFYPDALHLNNVGNFYAAEYILKRLGEITN